MFSEVFSLVLAALDRNMKTALMAVTMAVLIAWGLSGEYRAKKRGDDCAEERRADKSTMASMGEELRDVRSRLMDYAFGQAAAERQTLRNDSALRERTNRNVNRLMP